MPTHPIKTIDAQNEFACLLLVNITETIAGCEAGAIPRSGAEAGLLRILDAVIEGFDAGMDHFISKPFDLFELKQTLDEVVSENPSKVKADQTGSTSTTRLTA